MGMPDIAIAMPEIFLLSAVCIVLLVDLFWPGPNRSNTYVLSQLSLLGTALVVANQSAGEVIGLAGTYVADDLATVIKLGVLLIAIAVLVYSRRYLAVRGLLTGESFVLSLFGVLGMLIIASAASLLTLYLGLECMALSTYALVALNRDSAEGSEAAMKYFFLGALASGMLLYGMSLIYGVTGTLEIAGIADALEPLVRTGELGLVLGIGVVFIVVALAFKLGVAPFHMWVPDVYQGAPTAITLYLGTATKLAALALVARLLMDGLQLLLDQWQDMLVVLAVLSLAIGNVIAIAQTNIKRMLAYSTIAHMGFFLLGVLAGTADGYAAALFYMLTYALMSLGAFGVVLLLTRAGFEADQLDDLKGLNRKSPWYALAMMIVMLSMAGVPPTVGFFAKFAVIQAALGVDMVWLAVVAVLFAVIGAFYYLRIIKLMYFDEIEDPSPLEAAGDLRLLLSLNAIAVLGLGLFPGPLFELCASVF